MNRILVLTICLILAIPVFGQDKATTPTQVPAATAPQFSITEKLAITALQEEYKNINNLQDQLNQLQSKAALDLVGFAKDVAKSHPGYVFDPKTVTLVPAPKDQDPEKDSQTK